MTKVFARLRKALASPLFVGLIISVGLFFLVDFYYRYYQDPEMVERHPLLGEVERLHNQTVDMRLRNRGPRKGSSDVAILTIDERAIQKYGRWPWPRDQVAKVIDEIMSNGASTIAFDIIFSEKQEDMLLSLDSVRQELTAQVPQQSTLIEDLIQREKKRFDHDEALTRVIKKYQDRLIMGAVYEEFEYRPHPFQEACYENITKKNRVFDYWDKEAYLIGSQNPMESNLPPTWNKILQDHFQGLQENVSFEWLKKSTDHPVRIWFAEKGFLQEGEPLKVKAKALKQFTNWVLQKESDWDKPSRTELSQRLSNSEQFQLRSRMSESLNSYCLRYLTDEDELIPSFNANWDKITEEYEKFAGIDFNQARDYLIATSLKNPVHNVDHWLFNIPSIMEVTEHSGTFNATQDRDGSVRRAKLFVRNGNLFIPSLAFKNCLVIRDLYPTVQLQANPYDPKRESAIVSHILLKNADDDERMVIPTDHRGQLPINYAGPQKMFSYLSAGEVLDGKDKILIEERIQNAKGEWVDEEREVDKKEYLKGKHFLFGATATGIYDLRVTPFEENYPGVETHANMLDNLLREDYLKTNVQEEYLMPFVILALGLLFSFLITKMGALLGLLTTVGTIVGLIFIDLYLIFSAGTVITLLFPLLTIFLLYVSLTFYKYLTEERMKRELKGTFQKYVSPEIVNELLRDPEKLELGGVKQEMTVFFSDVRGFTTISEKLDPRALSDLLNDYLTPMTEIIFRNSGTLDKYMGDAIMAFFGAPIRSDQHAAQACRAALQQIEQLFILQKKYADMGLPIIDIGIGINTGEMSVGNMGSQTVRNYTVMGDSVNLGSRLEGINKQYGSRIIISEFTQAQLGENQFTSREIDWVIVKGKKKPVRIFELIAEGPPQGPLAERLTHFQSGFAYYHERQWEKAIDQFHRTLAIDASDQTAQLYIKRCQDYMNNPPDENWDGVFTMTSK